MKNRIRNFDAIYGEYPADDASEYFFSEMLETRSRTFTWSIKCHIHSKLFQLFLINNSGGTLTASDGTLELQAPALLWIPPSHMHGFEWQPDVSGRIISISEVTVNRIIENIPALSLLLSRLFITTIFSNPGGLSILNKTIDKIDEELFNFSLGRDEMLNFYKGELILQVSRIINEQNNIRIEESNPGLKHFAAFNAIVKECYFGEKTVEEIASELHISSVHLNRLCNEISGKSASELIKNNLIEKAKRLLRHTTYSISEIAYFLKIDDPAYFSRLFRKVTGLSPKEYRNTLKYGAPSRL